jgi:hypothetical protein
MDELPAFLILITFIHENEENENRNILRELVFFSARKMRGHIINAAVDLEDPSFSLISFCRYSKLCQKKPVRVRSNNETIPTFALDPRLRFGKTPFGR